MLGLFMATGLVVAVFSLYKASMDGLMKKVGLVGNDFSVGIMRDKIKQAFGQAQGAIACDLPTRVSGAVKFLLSGDDKQGGLAFRLGTSRVICGARMLANGNGEAGTYEVLKGMGYLKQGYTFVAERVETDERVCTSLPQEPIDETVNEVLEATSGKIFQLIWDDWQKVVDLRKPVDARCLDLRQKSR